jgi:tetratricopeptide (TPR) repeat protein
VRAYRRGRAAARTGARADRIKQQNGWPGASALHLGEAHLHAGRLEEAHALASRALEYCRTHQARGREAYALCLLGDIATHGDPPEVEEAETSYRQALALAEALGMRPLLAHCHLGLGTLYAKTEQREQAHVELSAAIELYHAMEMTFWLPKAEAALAQAGEAGGARRDGLSIQ